MKTISAYTFFFVCMVSGCSRESASPSSASVGSAAARGLASQYKQMGSLAGVAERCYGSKAIPEKLGPLIHGPNGNSEAMVVLVKEYNSAYTEGVTKQVVWNGTKGSYSKPFDCASPADVAMIRKFEQSAIANVQ